ncbi:MAG: aminoacyl-tRNA hydrolase [Rhizobiales bacterium]|nr:aminoacyl-tRNA hydrolase [Hyphomicrobiales bacterium]NRB14076.1 aminoacyl-tRNA hydrolase [Hyphomicrobiales bacterium]
MRLIVGLGNPGSEYALNRHNVGFMAVDEIVRRHNFAPYKQKFSALVSDGRLGTEKVLIIKPQTFMNLSGQAVGEAMRFYKLEADDVIVLYDEIDLAPAKFRVKFGGGVAGHNGLKSLTQHIGNEYHRVRIGVGRPVQKNQVAHYVLGNFAKADKEWLLPLLESMADAAPKLTLDKLTDFKAAVEQKLAKRAANEDINEQPKQAVTKADKPPKAPQKAKIVKLGNPFAALKELKNKFTK